LGARGLPIRDDVSPSELRRLARHGRDPATARRMYVIANAPEGTGRAEAARLAGMERRALRDAVVRYNAEGLKGLYNRRPPPRPGKLTAAELQELSQIILAGPDPELGLSAWTLPELCRLLEARFNKRLAPCEPFARAAAGGFLATKSASTPPQFGSGSAGGVSKGSFWRRSTWRERHIPTSA
jgi:transposase